MTAIVKIEGQDIHEIARAIGVRDRAFIKIETRMKYTNDYFREKPLPGAVVTVEGKVPREFETFSEVGDYVVTQLSEAFEEAERRCEGRSKG